MSYRQEILGDTFYWRALYIYLHRNDNRKSSNKKKTADELDKEASKPALTVADNRPLHTQHIKISLFISRMQRS